ncbi:hypothetical protein LAV84_22925 [Rhizobium sp. VS19-DR104.2]|uniref:hypothetical protein n=1 Tax=unclassified Rhizobium TaxID=2613769 RepID=UPI001C5AE27E|nr:MULTISPECIES: hypothetical protein [unclassified Rhizobium]MBZ5762113.1 hypothetical protein [Rhizobium sp. VS19-DR96]MBZ5768226.1 hypothetical protein [Rhizobium sp. VS19-DR129.2]MBZ5775709.1 hypothetical protein [Rhizobium sp. VS19-DRK62.2]MBZ5786990.1 hypothetical protein [Rhizobium sp. VS19-DR121]MBZ5804151.1 hypothetical protein [Rhizobium sp. VS19-DR181]
MATGRKRKDDNNYHLLNTAVACVFTPVSFFDIERAESAARSSNCSRAAWTRLASNWRRLVHIIALIGFELLTSSANARFSDNIK